ncbi:MAG: hypothetical protein IJG31_01930 [Fusobacterium sp.]|nr:hypothetical protein [Fusobacterium sp.]
MSVILSFFLVMLAMAIGDFASMKTKAFLPSVFVTALVFLLGFWYFFPADIISVATLGQPVAGLVMYLLIVHMGTLMNIKELVAQWKTVVISLFGVIGIIVFLMTIGSLVLGRETALVGAPPLTGGIVAAILMKNAAEAIGKTDLAVIAILVYVVQGFVGYPLTAILLKKEGNRLLNNYRQGIVENIIKDSQNEKKERGLDKKYDTVYITLLRLAFVAWLADISTKFINTQIFHNPKALSPLVTCLIFGVIAAELGIVNRQPLNKANSFGWSMTCLMAFIFEGLNKATPEMLLKVAGPLIGIIIIGVAGLLVFAFLAGKILKESKYMSLPIAMNALYGFPPNFILTTEAIKSITEDENEIEYLTDIMMPKMLIGGFTSVTIASVIVGGIFAAFL